MAKWKKGRYAYEHAGERWHSLDLAGLGSVSVQKTNGKWWWCWVRQGHWVTRLDPMEYKTAAAAKRAGVQWARDMVKKIQENLEGKG